MGSFRITDRNESALGCAASKSSVSAALKRAAVTASRLWPGTWPKKGAGRASVEDEKQSSTKKMDCISKIGTV